MHGLSLDGDAATQDIRPVPAVTMVDDGEVQGRSPIRSHWMAEMVTIAIHTVSIEARKWLL